jgi:hypothetical protein
MTPTVGSGAALGEVVGGVVPDTQSLDRRTPLLGRTPARRHDHRAAAGVFVALFTAAVSLRTAMTMRLAVDGSVAALERVLPGRTDD